MEPGETFAIGDRIIDRDNTVGIVIAIAEKGRWVQYRCRPYATMANLLTQNPNFMRDRVFWNMRKNIKLYKRGK